MPKKFNLFFTGFLSLVGLLEASVAFAAAPVIVPPTPMSALQDQATSLWQLIAAGGTCMIFQGILSVLAVALVLYHFKTVKPEKLVPSDFCENLFMLLEKKEYAKAVSVCKQQKNLISSVALAVLNRLSRGKSAPAQIESMIQTEGKSRVEKLWQNLTYLGDIAVVAPLVGLLGTVLGMIHAFHYFKSGSIHPAVLTQGLAKAMVNTVFGLITAVICLVFYSYFRGKVSAVTAKAESVSSEMAQILSS